ncbi:ABC transporter permease [Metabacillus idriensis]|uniref:ABC transporter permease n=1 Tax=Metabacillus idriensis TaxID=324768 RepID=UPI00163A0DB7|nr:ABC transporter permease [Metabacillus idriensis]QNG60467.1 ABC transporter permease [Bacillus sp. PAMC26568]
MMKLIKNEHMKLILQKSSMILFIAVAVISILMAVVTKRMMSGAGVGENVLGYLSFSTGFLFILPFFALVIAGSIVANEFNWGTIKFLLIRPAVRTKVLLAKYITALLFGIYFLIFFFAAAILLGLLLFGTAGAANDTAFIKSIGLNYLTVLIEIIMMSTFAFMISSVFRNSSLAIGLSIFITFSGKTFVQLLAHYNLEWGKYILFAHTNLSQHLEGNRPLFEGTTMVYSTFVLCIYLCLFLAASWFAFTKRDVSI